MFFEFLGRKIMDRIQIHLLLKEILRFLHHKCLQRLKIHDLVQPLLNNNGNVHFFYQMVIPLIPLIILHYWQHHFFDFLQIVQNKLQVVPLMHPHIILNHPLIQFFEVFQQLFLLLNEHFLQMYDLFHLHHLILENLIMF